MPEQNWGSWAILDHTPENPKFPSFNQYLNDEEQKSADDLFFKGEITGDIDYYNTFGAESDGTNKLYWEELKKIGDQSIYNLDNKPIMKIIEIGPNA